MGAPLFGAAGNIGGMMRIFNETTMQDTINLTDPTLAATFEVIYLGPTLTKLRPMRSNAIDVGAHRGDVTAALADLGFRVLAIEPQPMMTRRLADRFRSLLDQDLLHIERCAASNRRGVGSMYLGSASTVNTLERDWTRVAFPDEFRAPNRWTSRFTPLPSWLTPPGSSDRRL